MRRNLLVFYTLLVSLAVAIGFLVVINTGGNSFSNSLKQVQIGMSRGRVIQILGKPQYEGRTVNGLVEMYYRYPKSEQKQDGLVPELCVIVLIDGNVVQVSRGYR